MFRGGLGIGDWRLGNALSLALCLVVALSGCRTVVDAAAGVFGPGRIEGSADAHVVYRLRPDCPALLARTISNGYTVLAPRDGPAVPGVPAFVAASVEMSGVFEGPVRTGEVFFRYVPPAASETWTAGPVDVVAEVPAVRLTMAEGTAALLATCGPPPEPEPAPTPTDSIPRTPRL